MRLLYTSIISIILILQSLNAGQMKRASAESFITFPKNINQTLDNAKTFEVSIPDAEQIFDAGWQKFVIENFPLADKRSSNLVLSPARPFFDERTEWLRGTKNDILPGKAPDILSFKGYVEGSPDSKVYLNYAGGRIYSIIEFAGGRQFSIAPDNSFKGVKTNSAAHIAAPVDFSVYPEEEISHFCGTDDHSDELQEIHLPESKGYSVLDENLIEVPIAVEGEYYFYQMNQNDYDRAAEYIASVMSLNARIYEENANITLYATTVVIHEDSASCPYYNRGTLTQKLYRMPNIWKNDPTERAIAVLFANFNRQPGDSYKVGGISMGGTPYKGSLCNRNRGYCVFGIKGGYQYPTTNYTWDVKVAAHEMGHNFGCPHTHNCFWEPNMIDTCITATKPIDSDGCVEEGDPIPRPGTIMSYCHLTNATRSTQLKFHERMKPLIRVAADKANCISDVPGPMIKLLEPLGETLYEAGEFGEIRWTYANVEMIDLLFSSDGGANWEEIGAGLDAGDSLKYWKYPDISSDQCLVLIRDIADPSVADTSILPFSIFVPYILFEDPSDGEKIGQKETLRIRWEKLLVDEVYMSFSSDAGDTWSSVADGLDRTYYDWDVPDIVSDNCILMIGDTRNARTKAYSDTFAIGTEQGRIISPNGGETLCGGYHYPVIWEAEFTSKIWLHYSTDDGASWRKVFITALDHDQGSVSWRVPEIYSENVIIKLSPNSDRDAVLDTSDEPFKIDSCTVGVDGKPQATAAIRINAVLPNPAKDNITLKLSAGIDIAREATIMIIDENGRVVKKFEANKIIPGKQAIKLSLGNIAQGNYIISLRLGSNAAATPLKIIR